MIITFKNEWSGTVYINTKMITEYWISHNGDIHINTLSSKHSFPNTEANFTAFIKLEILIEAGSDNINTEMSHYEKKQREKFRDVLNWLSKNFYTNETIMSDKIDAFNDLIDYLED